MCIYLDESGTESEEDTTNSDYSSLTEFVSEMINSEICGEIRGRIFRISFSLLIVDMLII